jgi:hypothetical protein
MIRISARLACLTMALGIAGAACHRAAASSHQLVERTRLSMGSELHVTAWTNDRPAALVAFDAVFAEFDRLEDLLSVWRPASDIVRLNAAAGQHRVPVSPDTREVLRISHQISDMTGGTFDVTFGALTDLWKFDHDQDNSVPSEVEIRKRLPLIDYRAVEVDESAGTAFLRKKGMRVHLGGIGKGYAVDAAVKIMRDRGFRDFMIQAGGDMYAAAWTREPHLRGARSGGRHVQHIRRLRALLFQERAALSSHHRFVDRSAGAVVSKRHGGHRSSCSGRRPREGRVHPGAKRRNGAHHAHATCRRRDRRC